MNNKMRIINVEFTTPNTIRVVLQDEDDNIWTTFGKQTTDHKHKDFGNKCRECGRPISSTYELCYSCNEDRRLSFS
jgi:hypothetical protein